jgi:hypothetical protein
MNDDFDSQYLGRLPDDPIMKALKKGFVAVADKDRMLFLPQSNIQQGIESIKHGGKPEDVLCAVLESMGKLVNDLHKQAMIRAETEVNPVFIIKGKL